MADEINRRGIRPEVVLCSTARRAIETLEAFSEMFAESADIHVERELYLAGIGGLTDRMNALSPRVGSAMLIGHNPAIETLAAELAGDKGDDDARERMQAKYPTGGLTTLGFDGPWSELDWDGATLEAFVVPRELG